jgi:hypothetical protein
MLPIGSTKRNTNVTLSQFLLPFFSFHWSAMSGPVQRLLDSLKAAIDGIPPGVVAGRRDGPLAKYLTPKLSKDNPPTEIFPYDAEDGAYSSFNIEWEHVFQAKSRDEPLSAKFPLVCRGKHGLILAHAWASHYAGLESTTATDLDMIQLRVEALLRLIPAA